MAASKRLIFEGEWPKGSSGPPGWEVIGDPWRFKSKFYVHSQTADNKELVNFTGIIVVDSEGDFQGQGTWVQEDLQLLIKFPPIIPQGKAFQFEMWAPFVTINAIYNQEHAINAGWAVDEYWWGAPQDNKITKDGHVKVFAKVAVRDDGWLYRVGYNVTVKGQFVDHNPPPIP